MKSNTEPGTQLIKLIEFNELESKVNSDFISERGLRKRCESGKYPGAKKPGKDWFIPIEYLSTEARKIYDEETSRTALQKNGSFLPVPSLNLPVEKEKTDEENLPKEVPIKQQQRVNDFDELMYELAEEIKAADGKRIKGRIIENFVAEYNSGERHPAILERLGHYSYDDIYKKVRKYIRKGYDKTIFIRNDKNKRGRTKISKELDGLIFYYASLPNKMLLTDQEQAIREEANKLGIDCNVSPQTIIRRLKIIKKNPIVDGLVNGEEAIRKQQSKFKKDITKILPRKAWQIDATSSTNMTYDPVTKEEYKETVIAIVDVGSAGTRLATLGVRDGETAEAAINCVLQAIEFAGGQCDVLICDNGAAYHSKEFKQKMELLGIKIQYGKSFTPTAKSEIEYSFRRQHAYMRKHHNFRSVKSRETQVWLNKPINKKFKDKTYKEVQSYKVTPEKSALMYAEFADSYNNKILTSGPYKGKSRWEIFKPYRGTGITLRQLNFLLLNIAVKRVKSSEVKVNGEIYSSPRLLKYNDQQVIIKYNTYNKDEVLIYNSDGDFQFLCTRKKALHPCARLLGTEEDIRELEKQSSELTVVKAVWYESMIDYYKKAIEPRLLEQAKRYGRKEVEEAEFTEVKIDQIPQDVSEILIQKTGTDDVEINITQSENNSKNKPDAKAFFLEE